MAKRDINILKSIKGEQSLKPRVVKSKKVYNRKKLKSVKFDEIRSLDYLNFVA